MRKYLLFAVLSFCLWGGVKGQASSNIQHINLSGDFQLDTVEFWAKDGNWIQTELNCVYLKGKPFTLLPDYWTELAVGPRNGSIMDTVATALYTFSSGANYLEVLFGVSAPSFFAVNPDGISIANDLRVIDGVRTSAINSSEVDILFINSCTDCPALDIRPIGTSVPIVNNLQYKGSTSYVSLLPNSVDVEITNSDQTVIYDTLQMDLSSFSGGSLVIMVAGFLNPGANQNGMPLSLCYSTPSGVSDCFPDVLVGLKDPDSEFLVSVYPTWFQDKLTVSSPVESQFRLFDSYGKLIFSKELVSGQSIVEGFGTLSSGIYFWEVSSHLGVKVGKVINE
jgi:hypothetical protein